MGTCYEHPDLKVRHKLARRREAKSPMNEIAPRLGHPPSTLYREIRRNRFVDDEGPVLNGYFAMAAKLGASNRRARRWLPRKRDIGQLSDHDIRDICDRLNATLRKCLGWKTPAEVFQAKMLVKRT